MKTLSKTPFLVALLLNLAGFAQQEVTVTIGYPDHESYFIYSIPPVDEHARFGGEYYFKVENTGTVDLLDWELTTFWKTLTSTWGVVEKTTLDATTGEIMLKGPSWDQDLLVGESFVLNGEWIPSASVEDWIEFLPRHITMTANSNQVNVVYDVSGTIQNGSYQVQKVKPIENDRKTFTTPKVVAYFPIFDKENAWCSLQRYGANIDELRVQLYSISTSGELRAGQDLPSGVDPVNDLDYWYDVIASLGVVDYCAQNGIELVPVIYNYNSDLNDFDQVGVHQMLSNTTKRTQHLNDINQLLIDHPEFDGIDVDYESLQANDRALYASFMEDLSVIVHNQSKILTTAVHTKVGHGTWYGPQAQDYERIGNAVDEFLIMTYDLHWATSPTFSDPPPTAGCQATPDWINDVAFFAVSEIDDPSKIQIGMPFYGYRWKDGFENHTLADPGVGLTYADALSLQDDYQVLSSGRDPNGQDPYFKINMNGTVWVCYYQDSVSIDYKLQSLLENDLGDYIGGIGIWRLGQEDDELWGAISYSLFGNTPMINPINCETQDNATSTQPEISVSWGANPNPVENILTITFSEILSADVRLSNIEGKVVKETSIHSSDHTWDVTDLASGLYFLQVIPADGRYLAPIRLVKR